MRKCQKYNNTKYT